MKLIYKILIVFYGVVIIIAIIWLFTPFHKNSKTKNYSYTLFDSTFTINLPFQLTDDSLRFVQKPVEDTTFSVSYGSQNIEFTIVCIRFKTTVPDKSKKVFLNTWITSEDSTFQSVSTLTNEGLRVFRNQKYEFYEGMINYSKVHRPTGHKKRYFTTLITSKKEYVYFIDIRYNDVDKETVDSRNKIFNSINIK